MFSLEPPLTLMHGVKVRLNEFASVILCSSFFLIRQCALVLGDAGE